MSDPSFYFIVGGQQKQRRSYWFSSGPMGLLNSLMRALPCNPLATSSTEFVPKTPEARFWATGLQLGPCRQNQAICRLPLSHPLVSSPGHTAVVLLFLYVVVNSLTNSDRCVLRPSEVEWTRKAQWRHFPLQAGLQETPRGPNAELNCCYSSHCEGTWSRYRNTYTRQRMEACMCEDGLRI